MLAPLTGDAPQTCTRTTCAVPRTPAAHQEHCRKLVAWGAAGGPDFGGFDWKGKCLHHGLTSSGSREQTLRASDA